MSENDPGDFDELLQPTVAAPRKKSAKLPWRVHSQFWVAFFGGVLAVTPIAYLNTYRLGTPARSRYLILLTGFVAVAAYAACAWIWFPAESRTLRMAGRIVAVVEYLALARIQRDDDNRHQIFGSGDYASLWFPGIAAILVAIAIMFVILGSIRTGLA